MKRVITVGICLVLSAAAMGLGQPDKKAPPPGHPSIPAEIQDWPKGKAQDVGSVDGIIAAFYEATGGEAGVARDWDRFRSLFVPDARLIPARAKGDGGAAALFVKVTEYIDQNRKYFEKGGFFDREVARRTESFGNISQVWSTYESRRKKDDARPYVRGINSIQLLKDGDRWWIVNVFWDYEREDAAIPEKYLQTVKN